MQNTKIKSFTDLFAWKEGNSLIISVYKLTKQYPKEEIFVLVSQIRRSAISITSNVAEGFSRKSNKEKIQFYHLALGSLTELQNQLYISKELGYIDNSEFKKIAEQTIVVSKLINGLIKSLSIHNT